MRKCPVCDTEMTQQENTGETVDVCDKHGVWLDQKELYEITEGRRRQEPGRHLRDLFRRMIRPGGDGDRVLCCPVCADEMVRQRYHEVQIDWCPDHGVWLDSGELEAILNNLRTDPAYLDGVALRLADMKL
jgi:Zn-finger nucleic acid-binding protein